MTLLCKYDLERLYNCFLGELMFFFFLSDRKADSNFTPLGRMRCEIIARDVHSHIRILDLHFPCMHMHS